MDAQTEPSAREARRSQMGLASFGASLVALATVGAELVGPIRSWLGATTIGWLGCASTLCAIVFGAIGRRRTTKGTVDRRFANLGLTIGIVIVIAAAALLGSQFLILSNMCNDNGCL